MSARMGSDAGLTLVEALVSLFVFGIIAAGCTAMLMQGADTQRRVTESHAALRELEIARALLASDVAQTAARETRLTTGLVRPRFVGGDQDTALAFVRASAEPHAEYGAVTALSFVEYVIADGTVLRRSRTSLDATDDAPVNERVVFGEVEDARFEFYDGVSWRTEWIAAGDGQPLPRAIALIATTKRYGEVRIEAAVGIR